MAISQTRSITASTSHRPRHSPWRGILLHGTLIFFCLIVILPLAWVLLLSVKSIPDAYTGDFWPKQFDFSHYGYVFEAIPTLIQNMGNSIFVTLSTVALTSICAILAGYALVHLKMPGKVIVVSLLVGSLFFPSRLISLISIFQIQTKLGLINTLPGLILPYVTLNLATSVLIMRGMFQQISNGDCRGGAHRRLQYLANAAADFAAAGQKRDRRAGDRQLRDSLGRVSAGGHTHKRSGRAHDAGGAGECLRRDGGVGLASDCGGLRDGDHTGDHRVRDCAALVPEGSAGRRD